MNYLYYNILNIYHTKLICLANSIHMKIEFKIVENYNTTRKQDMSSYTSFMKCIAKCSMYSEMVYNEVKTKLINDGFELVKYDDSYVFRVFWSGSDTGVSVSVPPDTNRNTEKYGYTLETVLWSREEKIVYNDSMGYDDVCRFSTIAEMVDELNRLRKAMPNGIPK